jgi:hypothetical protein
VSWQATAWALKQRTGLAGAHHTFLALANYANRSNLAWAFAGLDGAGQRFPNPDFLRRSVNTGDAPISPATEEERP